MGKKAGVILIKVNGKVLEAMPGVKVQMGGMERTEVIANDGVAGFYETPKGSMVQCTVPYGADTNLEELQAITNATIVINPDVGASAQINNAWQSNVVELSDQGGGFALEFKGPKAKRL
jgi:hypothetical protein